MGIQYFNQLKFYFFVIPSDQGMEEKRRIKDRRLLAKLVLIREEARDMLGGGLLDERNDNRGFKTLPGNVVY